MGDNSLRTINRVVVRRAVAPGAMVVRLIVRVIYEKSGYFGVLGLSWGAEKGFWTLQGLSEAF